MGWILRLWGKGPVFSLALSLSALLAGSMVWKFQALRYTSRIEELKAALQSYQAAVAMAQAKQMQAQAAVVTHVEEDYHDRLTLLKEKSNTLIQEVPHYVTPQDNARFPVNVGFVRTYNAAFSGLPATTPAQSDHEPAALPLVELAQTTAFNASICRQWREQALGWRHFYRELQRTTVEKRP